MRPGRQALACHQPYVGSQHVELVLRGERPPARPVRTRAHRLSLEHIRGSHRQRHHACLAPCREGSQSPKVSQLSLTHRERHEMSVAGPTRTQDHEEIQIKRLGVRIPSGAPQDRRSATESPSGSPWFAKMAGGLRRCRGLWSCSGSARTLEASVPVRHRKLCSACEPVGQHGGGGLPREPWNVASSTSVRLLIFLALPGTDNGPSSCGLGKGAGHGTCSSAVRRA